MEKLVLIPELFPSAMSTLAAGRDLAQCPALTAARVFHRVSVSCSPSDFTSVLAATHTTNGQTVGVQTWLSRLLCLSSQQIAVSEKHVQPFTILGLSFLRTL